MKSTPLTETVCLLLSPTAKSRTNFFTCLTAVALKSLGCEKIISSEMLDTFSRKMEAKLPENKHVITEQNRISIILYKYCNFLYVAKQKK